MICFEGKPSLYSDADVSEINATNICQILIKFLRVTFRTQNYKRKYFYLVDILNYISHLYTSKYLTF